MKTEYKLLWIDDNLGSIRGDVRNITHFLKQQEIDINLESINPSAGTDLIEDPIFIKLLGEGELDFLLVDYNMPGLNGVGVIEYIRQTLQDYHTPIVFYSNDATENLSNLINDKNKDVGFDQYLDGIFFCHRDDISQKMLSLMQSQLKREQKIKAVRGLLMEKVSDIDVDIIKAIRVIFSSVKEDKKNNITKQLKKKFVGRNKLSQKIVSDINDANYEELVLYIIDNPRATDNHFRAEMVRNMLKYVDEADEYGNILSDFYNPKDGVLSLNCFRNKYAHQNEEELQIVHSVENNLRIKSESRKHKKNMEAILSLKVTDESI